jgi:hypothetical protein
VILIGGEHIHDHDLTSLALADERRRGGTKSG